MKQTIAVLGLGLIGGSIALGIQKAYPGVTIFGYDISEEARRRALERGVVTQAFSELAAATQYADVIFLATPVKQTLTMLRKLSKLSLKKRVLLTDVGSTKQEVVRAAESFWGADEVRFVGGHPMAGSHKSGVGFADACLFENAYYLLVPSKKLADEQAIEELSGWLRGLQAKIQVMSAEEHDLVTSQVSHFPHVLAAALVNQSNQYSQGHPFTKVLAAGGFRDMTRIASSDVNMWTEILLSNSLPIVGRIDDFVRQLQQVKEWIIQADERKIAQFFEEAREVREKMPIHRKGGLPNFYDLFVNVPDYPGAVHEITGILKEKQLSLTNIRILETRTESDGVLQVSFKSREDLEKARQAIEEATSYAMSMRE